MTSGDGGGDVAGKLGWGSVQQCLQLKVRHSCKAHTQRDMCPRSDSMSPNSTGTYYVATFLMPLRMSNVHIHARLPPSSSASNGSILYLHVSNFPVFLVLEASINTNIKRNIIS